MAVSREEFMRAWRDRTDIKVSLSDAWQMADAAAALSEAALPVDITPESIARVVQLLEDNDFAGPAPVTHGQAQQRRFAVLQLLQAINTGEFE